MKVQFEACDECGRKHGLMVAIADENGNTVRNKNGDPVLIGDRECFLAYQGKRWTRMENNRRLEIHNRRKEDAAREKHAVIQLRSLR